MSNASALSAHPTLHYHLISNFGHLIEEMKKIESKNVKVNNCIE